MRVKVLQHKMPYGREVYEKGEEFDLPDNDPCSQVLVDIGRVEVVAAVEPEKATDKPKKKTGKIKRRDMTAED